MTTRAPIVVGVDRSGSALNAVWWAAREAALRRRPLHLVAAMPGSANTFRHAVQLGAPDFPEQRYEGRERLSKAHTVALDAVADTPAGTTRISVVEHLQFGNAVEILLAESRDAAMLVVGSHGLDQLAEGILGSVSAAVVLHAQCPVAVIRYLPESERPPLDGPVVVGVDGTENSEPAITEAFETASLHGVDLVAVHAWSDSRLSTAFRSDPDGVALDWNAISTAEHAVLSERLAGWREKNPDVAIRQVVVHDRPARQLITESKSAQLVVVGRRGRGGFTSMLLGSTSRRLMHTAVCPLLIVHSPRTP
ncbi:universal stress protein [Rhodococcus sp. SRB_17]|uniref:universal stress protein n=1 Tax=Rhodococcus sp. OK302 TaxID=1882769 RepID=UPI000B942ED7|nr:universal stress protein [Rhodococcus sp. OK302]NMM89573.1 universal stress protein [Rhodococcus sp. SRB_17]OYD71054.1 nucleotide-binding universal stress UspA family protein [Rhodococcus sp. OK302]